MQQPFTPPNMLTLLRGVSRSFYLSIRLLPAPLRQPIAVAYLLARAADTLADTADLPSLERRDMLAMLSDAIGGQTSSASVTQLSAAFAPLQQDPHERRLIIELTRCLSWLDLLSPLDRDDVRSVLRHITHGQSLDITRFAMGSPVQALERAAQLDEYTYLVAGCVGEFWTDLCLRHVPAFASLPSAEMREMGCRYGMSLQLVNILRDAGADLAAGRCYFPADELAAEGLRPDNLASYPERFEAVWLRWYAQAQQGLDLGMRYADAVESRRIRAASAMPALLAARTLALLQSAGPQRLQRKVKVPRQEVRVMMARLAFTLAGRAPLQAQFSRMRGPDGECENREP